MIDAMSEAKVVLVTGANKGIDDGPTAGFFDDVGVVPW